MPTSASICHIFGQEKIKIACLMLLIVVVRFIFVGPNTVAKRMLNNRLYLQDFLKDILNIFQFKHW